MTRPLILVVEDDIDVRGRQGCRSASRGYEGRYGRRGGYANVYREGFKAGHAEEFRESGRIRR